jgi:uncharacterized membrane protein YgaE (UPF0421/DUF939 family)
MNDRLITDAEKLLQDLIDEAKRMDAWFKDEVKRKNYREMKERQLALISEMIEEIKNVEQEVIYLEVPIEKTTLQPPKIERIDEMSIRKIEGLYGREQARTESIRRTEIFMDYLGDKYSQKSLQ